MRRVWSTALWWLCAAAIPIASASAIFVNDSLRNGPRRASALGAQFYMQVLLTEAAAIVVAAPLAGIISLRRTRRNDDDESREIASTMSNTWQVARPLLAGNTALIVVSAIVAFVMPARLDTTSLLTSHVVLWSVSLALAALGALCASLFRDALDAAASAIGIAMVSAAGVFAAGPALNDVPQRLLDAVLVANPIVTTAASANFDIFRTALLYQLSPLAHTQFTYPHPGTACAGYTLAAQVLLLGTARAARSSRHNSLERISA